MSTRPDRRSAFVRTRESILVPGINARAAPIISSQAREGSRKYALPGSR